MSGWRVDTVEQVGSTQDEVLRAANRGDPGHYAVRAHRQTAGRGRGGRAWAAPAGNLNLSLLLRPDRALPRAGQFALLAGVAVIDAILAQAPGLAGLQLKWPNDIMLGHAKCGGILIDSALGTDGHLAYIVIGIGVNLVAAPDLPDRPTANLGAYPIDADRLTQAILAAIDRRAGQEFAALRAAWLDYAHPIGTLLRVRQAGAEGESEIVGRFAGLSPLGELLLQDYLLPIVSAEIFLPQVETP